MYFIMGVLITLNKHLTKIENSLIKNLKNDFCEISLNQYKAI